MKRNILANLSGGAWSAIAMTLAVPFQIRLLGPEALGLVALTASLQVVVAVLDFGLTAAIVRDVAGAQEARRPATVRAVRTAYSASLIVGLVVGSALFLQADWIVREWLKREALPAATSLTAIQLAAVFLALRLPVGVLHGVLTGLRRLDLANLLKTGFLTIRIGGGTALLTLVPDVRAYLACCAAVGALELIVYAATCKRLIPELRFAPRLFPEAISGLTIFALQVGSITALAMLLTQADKIVMSRLLPLRSLGYYSLAYSIAMALSLIPTAVAGALFPAIAAAGSDRESSLESRYDRSVQLIAFTSALPTVSLVFYSSQILAIAVGQAAATEAAHLLSLLAIGFFLNGLAACAYTLAVARGRPSIPLRVNAYATAVYLPATYALIRVFGSLGGAIAWLLLNAYYVVYLIPLAERELLGRKWGMGLRQNAMPAVAAGVSVFALARAILAIGQPVSARGALCALAASMVAYLVVGIAVLPPGLRSDLLVAGLGALERVRSRGAH